MVRSPVERPRPATRLCSAWLSRTWVGSGARRASSVPRKPRSHGRVIGVGLRLDESLPFVFVYVRGAVPNRTAHFQEFRADSFETPRSHGETRNAQPLGDLDVRQDPVSA